MEWTTEKPTERGWYHVYGVFHRFSWKTPEEQPNFLTIVELTRAGYKNDYDENLYINERTNFEVSVRDCGFTHWMKIRFPPVP